ncbi:MULTISPECIES: hypothetical protein [Chryseobacterium]|uniref:C1q domain-containing protein n=1 Tax=Chryseobacterium indologenes TaxID=253 RepID=A0AAD0YZ62_CHRID|nr:MULTISPECIES: hypothetical protein [Chryseobacterium]ASE63923.1 hypothetical protein CEQ15_21820 [Chryseobacterium indologenes]AZB19698.1 hypothetical protein EG352_18940 [Chryseobacterium indologenes]
MKKKLLYMALLVMSISSYAQVGIHTSTPQHSLHVNGSLQVVKDINVGGNANTKGSSGNRGEFLMSNGAGNAPVWRNIESENFLKVIYVGNKNDISPASGSYTGSHTAPVSTHESYSQTYIFNVSNKIDTSYLTYNSGTGLFTVVKAGFYNIVPYVTYDLNLNPSGQTAGTANSYIQRVAPSQTTLAGISTGHGERTTGLNHNLSSINFFNPGDTFRIRCRYTQNFRLSGGNIHISYLTP